jgi:hypothetical protein
MSDCCADFSTTVDSATRTPAPIWIAHDDCGYKALYTGVVGTSYPRFMPVKFGTAPNTVVPAPTGVGAIGLSDVALLATALDKGIPTIRKAANVAWADVAAAIGAAPTSQAAWWPIHQELAKVGIFVSFT